MDDKNIVNTNFTELSKDRIYSISEASEKLKISTVKINHIIFKINKLDKSKTLIQDINNLTNDNLETIELFEELHNDEGMSYEDIVKYFLKNSNNLVNKKDNTLAREINDMDSKAIAKSLMIESKKQTELIINTFKNEILNEILNKFSEESIKIGKATIEAMNITKNDIDNSLNEFNEKLSNLNNKLEEKDKEIERLYNEKYKKQDEELREKLKQTKIEYEKKLEYEKNKSWIDKIKDKFK